MKSTLTWTLAGLEIPAGCFDSFPGDKPKIKLAFWFHSTESTFKDLPAFVRLSVRLLRRALGVVYQFARLYLKRRAPELIFLMRLELLKPVFLPAFARLTAQSLYRPPALLFLF